MKSCSTVKQREQIDGLCSGGNLMNKKRHNHKSGLVGEFLMLSLVVPVLIALLGLMLTLFL
jgi:hypothetical protein